MKKDHEIRNFNLFGESQALPDIAHCERISTRSRLHNWEFKPHRHGGLHQVLLIQEGGGSMVLDGRKLTIAERHFINVPKGVVHGFQFQQGTKGWVVTLTSELVDQILPPGEGLEAPLARAAQVAASSDIEELMSRLFIEHESQGFARAQMLRGHATALLGLCARGLFAERATKADRSEMGLYRRFEAELETCYKQRPNVAELAQSLAVSSTHLSRISRAVTGRPASQILAERVSREARRMLVFTNLSVAEICYELGYQDPAHFSRVFKRWTGLSPRAFRDQRSG